MAIAKNLFMLSNFYESHIKCLNGIDQLMLFLHLTPAF